MHTLRWLGKKEIPYIIQKRIGTPYVIEIRVKKRENEKNDPFVVGQGKSMRKAIKDALEMSKFDTFRKQEAIFIKK